MSVAVAGFVKNGVVVPNAPLPEGAFVEIRVVSGPTEVPGELQKESNAWNRASAESLELVERPAREGAPIPAARLTPAELRRMPREQRQAILAAAAMAEQDYHSDK